MKVLVSNIYNHPFSSPLLIKMIYDNCPQWRTDDIRETLQKLPCIYRTQAGEYRHNFNQLWKAHEIRTDLQIISLLEDVEELKKLYAISIEEAKTDNWTIFVDPKSGEEVLMDDMEPIEKDTA